MPTVQRLQHASVPMPPGGKDAARRFYGAALGMEEIPPPSTLDVASLVWFRAGGDGHEVHCFTEERLGPNSPAQHLCLQVDDLEGFRRRLADHDVEIEDPTPIPNRPRLFVRDPFGNLVELTQILGPYDESGVGRQESGVSNDQGA
jgi:catechol 2,3-dioxygenase-like lactoylglutathione lyase family enzyme